MVILILCEWGTGHSLYIFAGVRVTLILLAGGARVIQFNFESRFIALWLDFFYYFYYIYLF